MSYITVGRENEADIQIYYKDWGSGQPIVFSHGWPLSADDWDPQMLFFLKHGYRVIAHDRRGDGGQSGRPSQGSVRRIAGPARGQSLAILSRSAGGAFLWLQRAGC